ncbi:MAG: chemotaxis response regulator protein-glutamate methylesterase [Bdellovibrionales bacterium]|nr:chemotaxis response regulator protein-glutamate methylesterase [Bdellovibrionales bacterium]
MAKLETTRYALAANEGLLTAHHARSGRGAALRFGAEGTDTRAVREWAEKTRASFGCPMSEIEFKLLGADAPLRIAEKAMAELGTKPKAVSRRSGLALEAFFYPADGRLRVAACEAAPKTASANVGKIRVLVVDDSSTVRKLLVKILGADPDLEIVGEAERPSQVEALIRERKPDVITLDLHMPEMDGVQCLKRYLPAHPVPTVIISSISMEEGPLVLAALEAGAVDYVQKPTFEKLAATAPMLVERVKTAARARVQRRKQVLSVDPSLRVGTIRTDRTLVFGSSTGGTEALASILVRLPEKIPPIVCVQHIPAVFSLAFAKRLDQLCPFEVKEAEDGDLVRAGRVLIAPGGLQMSLVRAGGALKVRIEDSPPVNRHKPSVDVLYRSAAKELGAEAVGIILTGMGADGADGLVEMRRAGARTIAQDEATSVVFGMPREAIARGGAEAVVPLPEIPETIASWLSTVRKSA